MKNFPNAFVIIIAAILVAWGLTFVIPQGEYQRITNRESGLTEVVNDSYQHTSANHLSAFEMLLTIPRGIIGRADLIVLILLIGGCFFIIEKTGALSDGLQGLVSLLEGREVLGLILVAVLFAAAGASIGLQEEVIAMTPVLLLFGKSLGYNTLSTIYMSYGSAVIGSGFSPANPFAVFIAQKEAGLQLLSGSEFRMAVFLVVFIVWVIYLIAYSRRNRIKKVAMVTVPGSIGVRSKVILLSLCFTFAVVFYGLLKLDWGFNEMSAAFFALGIFSGLVGKLGVNETGLAYIEGFKEMIFAAMILGLANSITLILKESTIIDSIVYGLFMPLQYLPAEVSGVLMLCSHVLLHFPIPSYSGQAVLTMPILVPLSELIGLSRQTCVLAYQYGAVTADMIVPTNGALMGVLAVSGVAYNQWMKFVWRPTLLVLLIAAIAIVVAVVTGYS